MWRYTFDGGDEYEGIDYSLIGVGGAYHNVIHECIQDDGAVLIRKLPGIVLKGGDTCANIFGIGCESITLGPGSAYNTFGDYCTNVVFREYCSSNTLMGCGDVKFGDLCNSNKLGTEI